MTATGKVVHREGVETGEQPILKVYSIQAEPTSGQTIQESKGGFDLVGSDGRIEDIGGTRLLENTQTTIAFAEAGKVAGNGSCNRFFGAAEINGETINLAPLGATRMVCPEAVMD